MKLQFNKRYLRVAITAFCVIAASICFYYLIFHGDRFSAQVNALFKVMNPVLYGIVFAYLMTPMINSIERYLLIPVLKLTGQEITVKRKKHLRILSIIITLLIVYFLIYAFFSILIPNILQSIKNISYQFPYYVDNMTNWSARFLEDNPDIEKLVVQFLDTYSEEFASYLNNSIVPQMETLVKQVSLSLISVLKVLWNFIIGMIISIYVLYSKELFAGQAKKTVFAFFQAKTANQLIRDIRFASDTFIGFISGKILDSFIIGCICFFCSNFIMQLPYALLVSVIVGVTNVIPFFGPYLGAIPSAILILMVNPLKCVYFIIFIVILQQIDGNFIGPKILGQSTGLSGFWVIFSITVFGGIMGIPGMIIGVPFFAVLYALARRNINRMLKKRGLPQETNQYQDLDYIDDNAVFVLHSSDKKSTFFKIRKKAKNKAIETDKDKENSDQ